MTKWDTTMPRRALIIGLLGSAVVSGVAPAIHRRSKRKRKKTPVPSPLTDAWSVESAPRTIPLFCGVGPDWIGPMRAAAEMWNSVQPWLRLDVQEIPPPAEGAWPEAGTILLVAPWSEAWWGGFTQKDVAEHA